MPAMGGDPAGGGVAVALLGPVEIGPAGGVMTPVAQPRLRVLLGLLGVAEGRVVTAEALVDGVWGEEWSPGRERNLHALVYQLRRRLAAPGAGRAGRGWPGRGPGTGWLWGRGSWMWRCSGTWRGGAGRRRGPGTRPGRGSCSGGRWGCGGGRRWRTRRRCARGWPGRRARLEEARLAVVEERIGCDLALGRHGEVAGELAGLVAEFPLRERLAALLMTALVPVRAARGGAGGVRRDAAGAGRRSWAWIRGRSWPGCRPRCWPMTRRWPPRRRCRRRGAAAALRRVRGGAAAAAGRGGVFRRAGGGAEGAGRAAGPGGEDGPDGPGGAVVISAVAGMAGVGKTALAVHWARKVAGRFPDGQLYVNLRGYDAEGAAVTAEEVTGWFLVALGVPAGQIPADAQARSGLYRSVLAGRRVLVVLDNARDAAQVRPLLPGSAGCLVVVTSRSALAGLAAAEGARPLRLGPLGAEEGVRLLAARLGPERVAAEPEAVTELISRCGHLPLALAVMAARAAADPGLPLGVLAGQLAGAADAEAAGRGPAGRARGGWRCWRPGTRPPACASCCPGRTASSARRRRRCSRCWGCTAGRTSRSRPRPAWPGFPAPRRGGRWPSWPMPAWPPSTGRAGTCCTTWSAATPPGQAAQALGEAGIRAAVERSVDHYLHTGVISCDLPAPFTLAPPAPGVLPERLAGEAELQDWAQANQQVQLQAIAQAAAAGLLTRAWQMFFGQSWSLGGQGYWADFLAVGQVVLAAAEAAGRPGRAGLDPRDHRQVRHVHRRS